MKYIKQLTIDIDKKNNEVVQSVQYDSKTRFIHINLVSNAMPFDITGCSVKVSGIKSDNTGIFNNCTVLNAKEGFIEVEVTEQMNAVEGLVKCELKIYDGKGVLTTKQFNINVTSSVSSKTVESSNEFGALTEALNKVNNIDNKFNELTADAVKSATEAEIQKQIANGNITSLTLTDGSVDNKKIANNAITYNKTDFIKAERVNYFDMDTVQTNSTMSNGVVTSNSANWVSDYIEGIESDTLYSFFNLNACNVKVAEFTVDNKFIKQQNWVSSITTSSNCRKVRIETSANNTTLMMVKGNIKPNVFLPYSKLNLQFEENLSDEVKNISKEVSIEIVNQMPVGVIKSENTNFVKNYKNLWDDNNVVNEFLRVSNGMVENNLGSSLNFTEVYENMCYVANFKAPMLCYREDKTFIDKVEATGDTSSWRYGVRNYITPKDTKYIRFNKHVNNPVLIQGNTLPIEYNYSSNTEPKRRLPNDDIYVLEGNLDLISAQVTPLYNKKIGFLGDSITMGSYAGQNYGDSTYVNVKTYHDLLSDVYYFINVNYGIGGTGFTTNGGSHTTFYERVEGMADDLDVIVVYGGWNDRLYANNSLGTIEDETPNTLYGAVQHTVKLLKEKYPNKPIIFMTHFTDTEEIAKVNKAIKEVCLQNYIDVIDLSHTVLSEINDITRKYYFKAQDGVHPNTSGHKILAQYISSKIKEILLLN